MKHFPKQKFWLPAVALLINACVFSQKSTPEINFESRPQTSQSLSPKKRAGTVSRLYDEAVSLYAKKHYREALTRFRQVETLVSGYKQTSFYLETIPTAVKEKEEKNNKFNQSEPESIASLYKKALKFYGKKRYEEALVVFKKIEQLSPNFKKTRLYTNRAMERIKEKIEADAKKMKGRRTKEMRDILIRIEKELNDR